MIDIDQDKLEGLRELIKLLLALTRAERPRAVYPYPPFAPPAPPQPPMPTQPGTSDGGMNLLRAAEIVERGGAHALEAIRKGTDEARKALLRLAEQRDLEQNAVEQVIESLTALKALQHRHRHQGDGDAQQAAPHPHEHAHAHATSAPPRRARKAGAKRRR
ncbi:hypothetical protein SAMN04487785_105349 [Dyella jiangningensis]|uniref:hypothetical protein n=1 Tax=Dyella sp. AtDHG13 TaxID=1938897 RepID=UPI000889CE54|nr:hypothetical protein [Dyella sp. AtDHG13]PXV52296.1 hypothetical protein BDW41_12016 [Dyella sp. AtDHG13]SDK16159.1 hypothetical protein SAMN04487785_105349 [Dyella jiangningensis]